MVLVGSIVGTHGLKGALKFLMKYSYSVDLLINRIVFDEDRNEFFVKKVFGVVKNRCIIELEDVDTIEKANILRNMELYSKLKENEYYNAQLIGFKVYRNNIYIGKVLDVFMQNGVEFLETHEELIDVQQIKSIDYESFFVFLV